MKSRFDKFGIGRGKPMLAIDARWIQREENEDRPEDVAIADLIRRWLDDDAEKDKSGNPPK
jgi:hypothetical protein